MEMLWNMKLVFTSLVRLFCSPQSLTQQGRVLILFSVSQHQNDCRSKIKNWWGERVRKKSEDTSNARLQRITGFSRTVQPHQQPPLVSVGEQPHMSSSTDMWLSRFSVKTIRPKIQPTFQLIKWILNGDLQNSRVIVLVTLAIFQTNKWFPFSFLSQLPVASSWHGMGDSCTEEAWRTHTTASMNRLFSTISMIPSLLWLLTYFILHDNSAELFVSLANFHK